MCEVNNFEKYTFFNSFFNLLKLLSQKIELLPLDLNIEVISKVYFKTISKYFFKIVNKKVFDEYVDLINEFK